jgi:CheY-like chemotaxis protein
MSRKHFDVILTDITRGIDHDAGLKFIEEVRKADKSTPIVVYTFGAGSRAEKARALGANAVVTTPGELLTAVLNVLPAAPRD